MTRAENARNRNPQINDYCLGTKELSAYLGCNPTYMHKLRAEGRGPAYHVIGGRVLYRWVDVLAWMDMHKRHTAESIETENDSPEGGEERATVKGRGGLLAWLETNRRPRARGDGSGSGSIEQYQKQTRQGFPRACGDGSGEATSPASA